MIKLRLSAFASEGTDKEINFLKEELLSDLIKRSLGANSLEGKEEFFQVLVNGHTVDREFWPSVQVKETDSILIAPIIQGGNFGQIFKMVAIIVVTVVASVLLTPAGGATVGSALMVAGISVGTSLLLNSLIPPPVPGGFDIGGLSNEFEKSQMYTITSQANSTKKFGSVPKVYGQHRMFPTIAANPYTEIETDASTGELVQYYYGVYDFGLGPLTVSDIRIGNTPLSNFSDVEYSLADFNKPAISEGVWDDALKNTLTYYKGDSETDNTTVVLDANESDHGALEDYQVIRNSSVNSDGVPQEIILTFVNPQGLIAYGTNGDTYTRSIDIDIHFSKVGEDNWKSYSDVAFVENFKAVGGSSSTVDEPVTLIGFSDPYYEKLTNNTEGTSFYDYSGSFTYTFQHDDYGIKKGKTYLIMQTGSAPVGRSIFYNGRNIGKVQSIVPYSGGFSRFNLESPIPETIVMFTREITRTYYGTSLIDTTYANYDFLGSAGKFVRKSEGRFIISRKETGQVYSTVKFTPKERGQFKVRITRLRSYSGASFNVQDKLAIGSIVTRFDRSPILTTKRHVFLEIKIRATNQLNGSIQNLSAVCTSVLDTWDGTQWVKKPTSNPAWVFADLLTGEVNKRKIDKSRLDTTSLKEWADFCDETPTAPTGRLFFGPRFTSNFILDFATTLQTLLNQVSNACQASLNIVNGKYGVLIDKRRTIPVQIFTARNSTGFSSTRFYSERPHAIKVRYIDPNSDWEVAEKIVYDDGYDAVTAVTFDELSSFACTDSDQAWRFGRYMMAQNKLRQETMTLTVDFEFLVCNRGDYVQITQDVMKVGGTPARVKSVVGDIITLDNGLETNPALSYGYVARSVSGIVTNTLTVINSDTVQVNGVIPNVGDLIVIGEMGLIVYDCLVKSIVPNDDLTATIQLTEKADAVYDAESSDTIPNYDPRIPSSADVELLPPPQVTDLAITANSWLCGANSFEHYISLDWDVPVGTAFEYFEIYRDEGRGYDIVTTTRDSQYTYMVNSSRLGFDHNFKVVAVSSSGKKIDLGSAPVVTATPTRKTAFPANVAVLNTNITGEVLQLDWDAVNDCISEYLIRYSPSLDATWVSSIPLLRVSKNTTSASVQARVGTYLIKAIDFNENESAQAALAITTIPSLTNLNIISTVTDFPTLLGAKTRTVKVGSTLMLKNKEVGGVETNEYYSDGYYYYKEFLDLGDIYTVRLQSLIRAEGYTADDIMANWVTLSSLSAMSNSRFSEWDVETQYRGTDRFNVMAEWTNLTSINPISEGVQDVWTEWKKFTIGDATARILQFRLKLISNKASVTPRVFDDTIKADMPDRSERYDNLVSTLTGYEVLYSPAFKGPGTTPNVQITIEDGQSGDYWIFDYKSLDGFKIIFYDKTDTIVSRTFDAQVRGFGRKADFVI